MAVLAACGGDGVHHLDDLQIDDATVSTAEDTAVAVTFTATDKTAGAHVELTVTSPPKHGTLVATADPLVWTYTPEANYDGPDSASISGTDGAVSADAELSITVTAVEDAPVAADVNVATDEDTPLSIPLATLAAGATDADGDTLTVTIGTADSGLVMVLGNAAVYTPAADFFGTATFAYTVDDGNGGTASATVHVAVAPVDDAPVAADDLDFTTDKDTAIDLDVVANDTDVEDDALVPAIATAPAHGTATVVGDLVHYVPDEGFVGVDSFDHTASDGDKSSETATVAIAVVQPNRAPVANASAFSAILGEPTSFTLTGSDADGDVLTFALATKGVGEVVIDANGTGTYTALLNATDTFTFTVTDTHGATSVPATVTVSVAVPVRGNGVREGFEQCDDGNPVDGDGCDTNCSFTCGDGGEGTPRADAVDRRTGACFAAYDATLSYEAAASSCLANHGRLATIADVAENDVARSLVGAGEAPWLGLDAIPNVGNQLHWITGEPLTLNKTTGAFPAGDACAQIHADGTWTAEACDAGQTATSLLCEFDMLPGPRQFASATDAPTAIAVAGDVVTASSSTNTVTYHHNDRAGGFGVETRIAVGAQPAAIAMADIDGDGFQDVAVANKGDNTVTMLCSQFQGDSFPNRATIAVGSKPSAVAFADVTGDGVPDLIVVDSGANQIEIRPNLNDVNLCDFGAATTVAIGAGASAIAVADLDGDGDLDLVTANTTANTVSVLIQGATHAFARTDVGTGAGPVALALADLDGDGTIDVATANSTANTATVLRQVGGVFGTPATLTVGKSPSGIAAADFNFDGTIDLAVANKASNDVTVLFTNSLPGFVVQETLSLGTAPSAIAASDVEAVDFRPTPDLLVAATGDKALNVVIAPEASFFSSVSLAPVSYVGGGAPSVVLGSDSFTASDFSVQAVALDGTAAQAEVIRQDDALGLRADLVALPARANAGAMVDMNGDFVDDLVTVNTAANKLFVQLNDGTAAFGTASSVTTGAGPVAVAGVSGVLAVLDRDANELRVLQRNADGTFTLNATVTTAKATPTAMAMAEFQTVGPFDGINPDLVIASQTATTIEVHFNALFDPFATPLLLTTGTGVTAVATGDVNGDGLADIVVLRPAAGTVTVFVSTDGNFTNAGSVAVGAGASSLAVGDYDEDGLADVVVGSAANNQVRVLLSDGTGKLGPATSARVGAQPVAGLVKRNQIFVASPGEGSVDLLVAPRAFNQ